MLRHSGSAIGSGGHGKSRGKLHQCLMIKLLFEEQAVSELQNFIRHYEEAFFELYRDSGVWNEDLIIESYRESAKKLYGAILQEIEFRLMKQKVLGRKQLREWKELSFRVGMRLV